MINWHFKTRLPKLFRSKDDGGPIGITPDGQALVNKANAHIQDWRNEIDAIQRYRRADECPSNLLEELGFLNAANIKSGDSEAVKRFKIDQAVPIHKQRSTWENEVKSAIDEITGLDAQFYNFPTSTDDDFLWVGDTGDDVSSEKFAVWGGDGPDGDDSGMLWIGQGTELQLNGVLWIDLGGTSGDPTAETIKYLAREMIDLVPAYARVILGYVDSGEFVFYADGIVN